MLKNLSNLSLGGKNGKYVSDNCPKLHPEKHQELSQFLPMCKVSNTDKHIKKGAVIFLTCNLVGHGR